MRREPGSQGRGNRCELRAAPASQPLSERLPGGPAHLGAGGLFIFLSPKLYKDLHHQFSLLSGHLKKHIILMLKLQSLLK